MGQARRQVFHVEQRVIASKAGHGEKSWKPRSTDATQAASLRQGQMLSLLTCAVVLISKHFAHAPGQHKKESRWAASALPAKHAGRPTPQMSPGLAPSASPPPSFGKTPSPRCVRHPTRIAERWLASGLARRSSRFHDTASVLGGLGGADDFWYSSMRRPRPSRPARGLRQRFTTWIPQLDAPEWAAGTASWVSTMKQYNPANLTKNLSVNNREPRK